MILRTMESHEGVEVREICILKGGLQVQSGGRTEGRWQRNLREVEVGVQEMW